MYKTDMAIIDGRSYLQGGQIIHAADAAFRRLLSLGLDVTFQIKLAKLTRKMACNGELFVQDYAADYENDAAMIVSGKMGNVPVRATFVPDPARPADRNENSDHRLDDLIADGEFSGTCHLSRVRGETLIFTTNP